MLPDLVAQRVVEVLDRARLGLQHRVAELAHVRERGIAPGDDLGVELRFGVRFAVVLRLDFHLIARRQGFGLGQGFALGQGLFVLNLIECFVSHLESIRVGPRTTASQTVPWSSLRVDVDAERDLAVAFGRH